MKIFILFFFIFTSSELFSQSWELLYKEDILQYDYKNESYGSLNILDLTIKGDSTIYIRFQSDTLLMIYNQITKEWHHTLKKDFWKCLKNDSLYNIYKESVIENLFYDSKGNMWFQVPHQFQKVTDAFKVTKDSAFIFNKIFVKEYNDYSYIYPVANHPTIYTIKEDKNGDIWMFLHTRIKIKDSVYIKEHQILSKYVNDRFESVFISTNKYTFISKCNFDFDNLNRVWVVNGDTCYIVKDGKVEKKFSTWDAEGGYGYFSEFAIDSKNNFYATNNSLILFKYDGEKLTTDQYVFDIERYTSKGAELYLYWLRRDSSDNIWLTGYLSNYLYKLDSNRVWTKYDVPMFATAQDEWCYKVLLEIQKDGKLWSAGYNGAGYSYGFYIFDPDGSTGLKEQINSNTQGMPDIHILNIYPNPADQQTTLDLFVNYDIVNQMQVCIYDILGTKIKDVECKIDYDSRNMRTKLSFAVGELPKGTYVVTVKAGKSFDHKLLMVGF